MFIIAALLLVIGAVVPVLTDGSVKAVSRIWCGLPIIERDLDRCRGDGMPDERAQSSAQSSDFAQRGSNLTLDGLSSRPTAVPKTSGGKLSELARGLSELDRGSLPMPNHVEVAPLVQRSLASRLDPAELTSFGTDEVVIAQALPAFDWGSTGGDPDGEGPEDPERDDPKRDDSDERERDRIDRPGGRQSSTTPRAFKNLKPLSIVAYVLSAYVLPDLIPDDWWPSDWLYDLAFGYPPLIDLQIDEDEDSGVVVTLEGSGRLRVRGRDDGVESDEWYDVYVEGAHLVARREDDSVLAWKPINRQQWTFDIGVLPEDFADALRGAEAIPTDRGELDHWIQENPALVWDPEFLSNLPPLHTAEEEYVIVGNAVHIRNRFTNEWRPYSAGVSKPADSNATRMVDRKGGGSSEGGGPTTGHADDDEAVVEPMYRGWRNRRYFNAVTTEGIETGSFSSLVRPGENAELILETATQLKLDALGELREALAREDILPEPLVLLPSDSAGYVFAEDVYHGTPVTVREGALHESARLRIMRAQHDLSKRPRSTVSRIQRPLAKRDLLVRASRLGWLHLRRYHASNRSDSSRSHRSQRACRGSAPTGPTQWCRNAGHVSHRRPHLPCHLRRRRWSGCGPLVLHPHRSGSILQ